MGLELIVVLALFTLANSYFSFKSGHTQGLVRGSETCIQILQDEGIIEVFEDENGDEYIEPVQYEPEREKTPIDRNYDGFR